MKWNKNCSSCVWRGPWELLSFAGVTVKKMSPVLCMSAHAFQMRMILIKELLFYFTFEPVIMWVRAVSAVTGLWLFLSPLTILKNSCHQWTQMCDSEISKDSMWLCSNKGLTKMLEKKKSQISSYNLLAMICWLEDLDDLCNLCRI